MGEHPSARHMLLALTMVMPWSVINLFEMMLQVSYP
jgi:hypothetical protein